MMTVRIICLIVVLKTNDVRLKSTVEALGAGKESPVYVKQTTTLRFLHMAPATVNTSAQ